MALATVHLMRHGEVHNPDRVLYGRLPGYHLSELGYEMAERAAAYFTARRENGANIVSVAASPLLRAQETARPTAQALGLEIDVEPRIVEAGNRFEGMSDVKKRLRDPRLWSLLVNPIRPSWGEPYREQVARVMEAVSERRDRAVELGGDGAEAILVAHQLPIWVTRLAAERRPLAHDPRRRECSLASITSLDFDGDELVAVRYAEPCADLLAQAANLPGA
ncbi:histidine phosphatase family protein [Zhihengliuella halotolerans]|uniref:Broad specificity phosphatase PhoE n=1 Tax=Zhihengliuella halotolerans TaxID=370736 RepID=A0A4Q8AFE3_9MICC|nr:histidine phosphatase family protein [Zhihengliuella halotolerans]RZU62339.1 broad specificity phosphatase PhoE [Zhihengliuella halotolerans]